MEQKKHYRHRLSNEVAEYIKDYAVINEFPYHSSSEALERIVREHMKLDKDVFSLEYITETVTEQVTKSVQIALQKSISKEINRVRLASNNIDRNTQILIELVQGHMQMNNLKSIVTTDILKPDFLIEVEGLIQERITEQKQRKDNNQNKGEIKHEHIQ